MTKKARKIIRIDDEKCDGCGLCVPACAEGALQIVDNKAKLVSEKYCDRTSCFLHITPNALGTCLGECPRGAITFEKRAAEEFDKEAVKHHLENIEPANQELPRGCPSATVTRFERPTAIGIAPSEVTYQPSMLNHWPVQLTIVPPKAPFLHGADLMLVADCVPFAYADFHRDFLEGRALLVACPKLDDFQAHLGKLIDILRYSSAKSLTVIHMEVPCCSGIVHMAQEAIRLSGKDIPFRDVTISINGDLKS